VEKKNSDLPQVEKETIAPDYEEIEYDEQLVDDIRNYSEDDNSR
jgi:hypothetical protein